MYSSDSKSATPMNISFALLDSETSLLPYFALSGPVEMDW